MKGGSFSTAVGSTVSTIHLRFAHPARWCSMSSLLGTAFFLLILWVVLRLALAVTGVFLHFLWIIAIVLAILWVVGKLRGKS